MIPSGPCTTLGVADAIRSVACGNMQCTSKTNADAAEQAPTSRNVPDLLAPCSAEIFRTKYLDRQRLVIQRRDPDFFKDIISLDELDTLVTSVRIPASNVNLAQGDTPLPKETYCIGNDYVDKDKLLARHRQGATIILRAADQWSASLNRLRLMAEEFFGFESQINVYLTPAGQKSTPPHWDTHDLVVLQIAGSKVWRLYDGKRSFPLEDERFGIGIDHVSDCHEDIELTAGDTLYLPRGIIHEPVAQGYSVHISIGIHVIRWHQVLEVVLRLIAGMEGSWLRQACLDTSEIAAPKQLLDELSRLGDPALIRAAQLVIQRQFCNARAHERSGLLLEASSQPHVTRQGPIADHHL